MGIYGSSNKPLHELLKDAGNQKDASLLIPDLQRPYVWKPDQVVLLVDSLIRGWPFGTLLMWNVKSDEISSIPSRAFWTVVDQTEEKKGSVVTAQNPPAQFRMVLDGQQRLQSLLLAVGGDDWGFKRSDEDWHSLLRTTPSKGKYTKNHWTKGQLCLDLEAFSEQYAETQEIRDIDYNQVFKWVNCNPANGTDALKKLDNYRQPLPSTDKNPGKYIRLSRLWHIAEPVPGVSESKYRKALAPMLAEHKVTQELTDKILSPLAELMGLLGNVKAAEVTYLELKNLETSSMTPHQYNDAIVNIFARLNTAGRTLTQSEITFAWIKTGWNTQKTQVGAYQCFESLRQATSNLDIKIDMDELVRSISVVWSVLFHDGDLLKPKDLLNGKTLTPMATQLAEHWGAIAEGLEECADLLKQRGIKYGTHFVSLNAFIVLWAWHQLSVSWLHNHQHLKTTQKDEFQKASKKRFSYYVDRWIIISQWAGRWRVATGDIFQAYIRELARDWNSIESIADPAQVHKALSERMDAWLRNCEGEAIRFITDLSSSNRQYVRQYYVPLWIWHRLNKERWEMSEIALRTELKKPVSLDVDHIVSYQRWKDTISANLPEEEDDTEEQVNSLGNCSLLEKTFNISKSKLTLEEFLLKIYEFKNNNVKVSDWREALCINEPQLNPSKYTPDEIRQAVEARTATMKSELHEYIRGKKSRQD